MTNVFGNYVVQRLLEKGNQEQKKIILNLAINNVERLSMDTYGCRVI
jgi:pumilio RNA-binding family